MASSSRRRAPVLTNVQTDEYLRKFAGFLATQPMTAELGYDEVAQAKTREELGISSLNAILLIVNYVKENADGKVDIRPEWVPRLNDIEDILSVLKEIDELAVS